MSRRIEPLHLIYRDEGKTEWKINPQAASRLQQIQGDIGIIAIIGQYRTGKSYILNRLAGQSNGFALGHTVKGCTRGIWMWGEPVRLGNLNVILLDVEGLSDPMREDSASSKDDDVLFTLSVLLSSLFIINTTGTIDAKKFEALQVATNLSERIRVHGSDEEPNSLQIAEQMPYLLWLVRDFTLELTSDMRTDDDYLETCLKETPYKPGKKVMSADQVKQCIKLYFPRRGCVTAPAPTTPEQMGKLDTLPLESLNPKFRQKMKEIIDKISKEVTPKRLGSSKGSMLPVDGAGLVSMMTNYVTAINKGALPDVENAWQLLQKSHCAEAVNGAKKAFMAALERGRAKFVGTENRALDVQEFESVSAEAFKEAHEYFKKHAVGEPKTTATFLEQLGTELATYKEGKDGLKTVKGGLLKEFADKNYKLALTTGEEIVNQAINTLSETQYPDFEAFKVARERVAQELGVKLQKSVAFPELSERYLEALNNLSTKKGLQFEISAAEKEKERILAEQAQKDIENEKKNAELMEALANRRQAEVNVHRESDFLREQSEREYLEMKRRFAEEAKLREQQIQADRRGGFDVRADALQKELQDKTQETIRQLMMMQKEANDRQAALTERLLMMQQQPIPQPRPQPRQGGLLTGLLAPVTGLVDNLLGGLGLGQVLAPVTNLVDGVVNPLVNTVGGVTQPVVGAVGGLTTPVMQGVGGLTSPLTNTVGGLTQPLTKTVGGLTGGLGGTVGGLTGGLSSGLGNTFDTVGGLTSSALPYRSHGMI